MGTYLNPGNSGFEEVLNGDYIDKTGLIALINQRINTPGKLVCISRPRRFGKSYAAKMLCAYYDHTCDSHRLFETYEISKDRTYEEHINRYHVIYLDMTNLLEKVEPQKLIPFIKDSVEEELLAADPAIKKGSSFDQTLINAVEITGRKIVMIIDEWDAPIRESAVHSKEYLMFLRMLFKSSATTPKIFAAAYMTGILPIKKDGSQSAISDFEEHSIIEPDEFARYTGFLEEDVHVICDKYHADFRKMKKWYDGYTVGEVQSVYNPYSVICAARRKKYTSYWRQTSAADNLLDYIEMDEEGLQGDIAQLIAGETIEIHNPANLPDGSMIAALYEPYVNMDIHVPNEYVGNVMKLCEEKRGTQKNLQYAASNRVIITYELPFAEIVYDFFDRLKSMTRGYASMDYHPSEYKESDLVRLDILINGDPVDALAVIVHRESAYQYGRALALKLKRTIPRQLFEVAIQAAIGNKVIARETVSPYRKNVTAKCYGGDITRKRKLLEKQKEGKRRMKSMGNVELPQEAFLAALQVGKE